MLKREIFGQFNMKEKIKQLTKYSVNDVIAFRRHIHQNPELSFQEFNTAKYIAKQLRSFGIEPQEGIAGTGLVALIEGKNPTKKVVALRADMDALPITEANDVAYKSKNIGVMHACGHDVHSASLLGVAKILKQLSSEFEGTVKLIFQPGEEKLPGGASLMIKEGVLQNPYVEGILGQHVMPLIDAGKVGFRKGMYMASTDELYVTITGKGGHGAMPHFNVDPVMIMAQILVGLQQIVSRQAKPNTPTVLSFGKVIANGATNVIPNEVKLEGTFRTLDEAWRKEAHVRMKKMAEGIAESMGGSCEFTVAHGYPFLVNEEKITQRAIDAAKEFLGTENVEELDIWMAAEDFAFYSQQTNACFYRLGIRNEAKGITSSVHTPTFDIDETALETGVGLMTWLAIKELDAK
jgi:amidohydrolase